MVRLRENETPEEMSKRLEKTIANDLKIAATSFTVNDKAEYEKRIMVDIITPTRSTIAQTYNGGGLMEMASRVKEVLPNVPLQVICKELGKFFI